MKRLACTLIAALGIVLSGCANSPLTARDDSSSPDPTSTRASTSEMPTTAPGPPGVVQGQGLVIDVDGEPVLCMGPVAESYPPQCGPGPGTVRLTGWKWRPMRPYTDVGSGVKFGNFMVQGKLSGDALAVVGRPVPLALFDPAVVPDNRPCVAPDRDPTAIGAELAELPGYFGVSPGDLDQECVRVDVLFDDGTLQAWADDTYGEGSVLVNSALVEVSN